MLLLLKLIVLLTQNDYYTNEMKLKQLGNSNESKIKYYFIFLITGRLISEEGKSGELMTSEWSRYLILKIEFQRGN